MDLSVEAVILDLDGVVTSTATLHCRAWKETFDEFLSRSGNGEAARFSFDAQKDYRAHVDGKTREDGIRAFLQSRGLSPEESTVRELAERKNRLYLELLNREGPSVFPDAPRMIAKWKRQGLRVAVVSSSRNCSRVLELARITQLFDARIDGTHLQRLNLRGKPAPDLFLAAARALRAQPRRTVVVEDAVAGIQAARHGDFGKVIGISRAAGASDLMAAGADAVVTSLDEISLREIARSRHSTWTLQYFDYLPAEEPVREALCTLGNGYLGVRGAFDGAFADGTHYPGTYGSGVYNRLQSWVQERPSENEDIVNWPNCLWLRFRIGDGPWIEPGQTELLEFHQELDLERGVLSRNLRFRDAGGRVTRLESSRIVSMAEPHLILVRWKLLPENWEGELVVETGIDGRVTNSGVRRYDGLANRHIDVLETGVLETAEDQDTLFLVSQTNESHVRLAQAKATRLFSGGVPVPVARQILREADRVSQLLKAPVSRGQAVFVESVASLYTSRDHAIADPLAACHVDLKRCRDFSEAARRHTLRWGQLWHSFDVELNRNPYEQRLVRLNAFHVLQTASPNTIELDAGLPARGLHGEAYRGHVFWDELFIFPFFNFRLPDLSRSLLMYRYRRLNAARDLAREAGYRGAAYPWQSGSTGDEESPLLHLNPLSGRWNPDNTHLQRHVNAAIAFNVWQYYQATHDQEFLSFYGAEMLVEISRFWASRAELHHERGRYELRKIVGPDEFHTAYPGNREPGIDNNAYTNVMASWVLRKTLRTLELLDRRRREDLEEALGIEQGELKKWEDVSRRLYVPIGSDGIIHQFEGYEALEDIELESYRARYGDIQRLDRLLESEGKSVEACRAVKQADVLMLFYLFSAEELSEAFGHLGYPFDPRTIPANIDYYSRYTVHGSTLSRAIHSWVLARSDRQASWRLFQAALESDYLDVQRGATGEGIHLGAMAESIDLVQRCYSGLELRDDALWLNPRLPDELPSIHFKIRYRGHWISILITHQKLRVMVDRSWYAAARIGFQDRIHTLKEGDSMEFPLIRQGTTAPARQAAG